MRDGDVVKIEGLPSGRNITFTENNGSYKTSWELNGESISTGESTGVATVSLDGDSTLAVTNDLPAVAPTGYSATQLPFIFMGLFGLILLVVRLVGRRREQEIDD